LTLPGDLTDELKQAQRKSALQAMHSYQVLSKLLRRLHEKGIAVIVLKGVYLAEAVYEQVGLRSMRDADLLVKKEDLSRVEQEMLTLGYAPENSNRIVTQENHEFGYRPPAGGIKVEIHWTIFDERFPFHINMDDLWNRTHPITLAQAPAFVLSPEDLILHLCLHTVVHAYELRVAYEMRLRMLCDLGEVVRRFGAALDWQEIGTRARQWGAVRAVYVVLRLARELLEVPVPADWLASLRLQDFSEHHFDLAREQILVERNDVKALQGSVYLPKLLESNGLGNKVEMIRNRLLPARELMALKYPAPAHSWRIYLYYPVRWVELLRHYGLSAWHLLRGDPGTRSLADQANQLMELRDWLMSG
jgi:hypothetical protein